MGINFENTDCGGGGRRQRRCVFDFVWILIAVPMPGQGSHSYQTYVQPNQGSFILKDFSHSDKQGFRMQMTLDT